MRRRALELRRRQQRRCRRRIRHDRAGDGWCCSSERYEFSAGVAVDRKVTLMARTLSDLTSQNTSVTDTQLTNFFNASKAIMTPYPSTPVKATITELYVDPTTLKARVQWSKGARAACDGRHVDDPDRAQGRRHLSDLQRGQLQIRADRRLRHGQDRDQAERLHLHPSAPVALRAVQRPTVCTARPEAADARMAEGRHNDGK